MVADLTLKGFSVNLFDLPRFDANLAGIRERGGIEVTGVFEDFVTPNLVTTDIETALEDVDLIMLTTAAMGHKAHIDACRPHLKSGQIIVVNTGYFAALRFGHALQERLAEVTFAEYTLLPYVCRRIGPAKVIIDAVKQELPVAAYPAVRTPKVVEVLKAVYPQTVAAANVLETSFNNLNPIFHPAITLLNAGHAEQTKGDFLFYGQGVTPSVGRIIDAVDAERVAVAQKLGIELPSAMEWMVKLYAKYGANGSHAYEVFQTCEAHSTVRYPMDSIGTFSLFAEDLPYGLVPIASLGSMLEVPTPTIDSIIDLSSMATGIDYRSEGTTVTKLGLAGLTDLEIKAKVTGV
jgi:opine dehydrogenase